MDVAIIGIGLHRFGRSPDMSGMQQGASAVRAALADAGLSWADMQFAYGGSQDAGNADALVNELGPQLECHERFPNRVNAGFMQILNRQQINLRVFERGAGETQACGSGACAAAVAAMQQELVDSSVTIHLTGGDLTIEWQGEGQPLIMTGPAVTVFHGRIRI